MFMEDEPLAVGAFLELVEYFPRFFVYQNATRGPGIGRQEKYADWFSHRCLPNYRQNQVRLPDSCPLTQQAEKRGKSHHNSEIIFSGIAIPRISESR